MKIVKRLAFVIIFFPLLLTWGCYNEIKNLEFGDVQWSPELALPLFNTSFSIADLFSEIDSTSTYFEEGGRMVLFIKDDSLFSNKASDFYNVPNKTFPELSIALTQEEVNQFNNEGEVIISREVELEYTSNLDSLEISSAIARLNLEENFPAEGEVSIQIETKPKSGVRVPILSHNYTWNYNAANQNTTDTHDEAFTDVTFSYQGNEPDNLLNVSYTLKLIKGSNPNLIFNENRVAINLRFVSIAYNYLVGDLAMQEISMDRGLIETNIFDDLGDFADIKYYFEDPQFTLSYTNSLGVPIQLNVEEFQYFSDGQTNGINYDRQINLPKPDYNEATLTEVSFDEQLKEVLNSQPDSMALTVKGFLDPEDTQDNFVLANSKITIGYNLEIPLELSFSNLKFSENISVDNIDPSDAKYAIIYISSKNELPLDLSLKAVALDQDSTVLYTLFDNKILAAGSLNNSNAIADQIELRDDPNTSQNELDFLKETTSIAIQASVATTNNGTEVVKISSDAKVDFSLSIQTQYTIKLNN